MIRLLRRSRLGAEVLEFAIAIVVMFAMFVACMEVFFLYSQLIVAQHALSQTAMRVSATGSWSQAMKARCETQLPGKTGPGTRSCTLRRVNNNLLVAPTADARVISADNSVLVGAEGTSVRLEISYTQEIISACIASICVPPNLSPQIVRQIEFTTQGRRQPGSKGDDN